MKHSAPPAFVLMLLYAGLGKEGPGVSVELSGGEGYEFMKII